MRLTQVMKAELGQFNASFSLAYAGPAVYAAPPVYYRAPVPRITAHPLGLDSMAEGMVAGIADQP